VVPIFSLVMLLMIMLKRFEFLVGCATDNALAIVVAYDSNLNILLFSLLTVYGLFGLS
jgi:hypothetical protein